MSPSLHTIAHTATMLEQGTNYKRPSVLLYHASRMWVVATGRALIILYRHVYRLFASARTSVLIPFRSLHELKGLPYGDALTQHAGALHLESRWVQGE